MFSSDDKDTNTGSPSPCLSFKETNDYLITFNCLHKHLMEVMEKVSTIMTPRKREKGKPPPPIETAFHTKVSLERKFSHEK